MAKAYLDIETSFRSEITVVGIYRPPRNLIQIVHPKINVRSLLKALKGATEIVTYWGHRFDLPMIERCLGVDLRSIFCSRDLADDCHLRGLYGGLKAVEKQLGIRRETEGLDGNDAMRLWEMWLEGNAKALDLLLRYNRDDVVNLYHLDRALREIGDLYCF